MVCVFPCLQKCVWACVYSSCRLWENSKFISRQLDKIGMSLSTNLVNSGLSSFEKLENTSPRELELVCYRSQSTFPLTILYSLHPLDYEQAPTLREPNQRCCFSLAKIQVMHKASQSLKQLVIVAALGLVVSV